MTQIFVLGLLDMRPMSGYDIQTILQESNVEQWGNVLVGSIYHALKKMEREEYIEITDIEQTGHRQKAIYQITEKGKEYLHKLIIQSLSGLPKLYPTTLYAGLSFLDKCSKAEAHQALEQQIKALEEEKAELEKGLKQKKAALGDNLTPLIKLNFDNMFANIQNQIDFAKQIIEQVILPS
ncbi:MAG: PadR family transcriptional regulator [Ruminococcus sp.]|nr:PadR family transcriptional regulator [Ruminococcus sp.]